MPPSNSLSWRIPTAGDPRLLKLALAQIGLATVVAALVLLVAAPRSWLGPALAGLVPLAIYMAYRRWHTYQQSSSGPPNVRIDESGLHWLDAAGQERAFARADVSGFRVGREQDTIRPVSAVTLYLAGGFESQPIELHSPATSEAVRTFLLNEWQIAERPPPAVGHYDALVDIYSECHEEHHEWHWEGTREALLSMFAQFQQVADELPSPPPGARPLGRIILARRRHPTRLRLEHAQAPYFEHDLISAPAVLLRKIGRQAHQKLDSAEPSAELKFDVDLGLKETWTFHLHICEQP